MGKIGILMLDSLKKVDILQFLWITDWKYQLKEVTDQIWELYSSKESLKYLNLHF